MKFKKHSREFVLLGKYLAGEKEAGEILFRSIFPQVKNYVFSKTNQDSYLNEADKEDIIANAMMRAIDKQHLFNGTSAFSTFVIGFAENIIHEVRRKKQREAQNILEVDTLDDLETLYPTDLYGDPPEIIIKQEQIEALNEAVEMLSEDQRQILRLRLFNEMPFKDIVQLTGKSDDAIDSLFRRAIVACKRNFEDIYN